MNERSDEAHSVAGAAAAGQGDRAPVPGTPAGFPATPSAASAGIADGIDHPLDPRSVALGRTIGWIVTVVIAFGSLLGVAIGLIVRSRSVWTAAAVALAWAGANAALGWWLHRWPEIEHRHASYRVDGHGLEFRHGVVWRRVVHVPRSRVQHTDVSQGPLERGYGLGTLSVFTAGTDHARVDLAGLDHATALAIRDHLLPREGSDAV